MSEDRIYTALVEIQTTLNNHGTRLTALEKRNNKWNAFFAALGAAIGGFLTSMVF